jgi:hypothetical protein
MKIEFSRFWWEGSSGLSTVLSSELCVGGCMYVCMRMYRGTLLNNKHERDVTIHQPPYIRIAPNFIPPPIRTKTSINYILRSGSFCSSWSPTIVQLVLLLNESTRRVSRLVNLYNCHRHCCFSVYSLSRQKERAGVV